jgi:nucleoid-associated protein EbfC
MPDMQALFDQASRMQQRMVEAQAELAEKRVTGHAAGGLVKATVDGTGTLVSIDIDPEVCDPSDTETLADLIVAAIRNASSRADEQAAGQLEELSGGLGLGAPGLLGGQTSDQDDGDESGTWGFGHPRN